jgi:adenylate cyclase
MATPSRKLAVILHADVVGSTTLVQKDETLAHVAFQFENTDHNQNLADNIRPELRVGISLGEVVIADGTITGAGVILAQRLEQLAEPGGVVVQGSVSETVPTRLPLEFESLGEQLLKGFDQPVRVFVAKLKSGESVPGPESHATAALQKDLLDDGSGRPMLELPDKPSIAVLPFTNRSGDPEHEHFSDGITEDIITELSRFRELFVIASNSTFRFKGKDVDIGEIAHQLGVQYIVEGSVRRSGKRVRITAQLVDALSESEVWADRYDRDLDDIFLVQDEVVAAIVGALPSRVHHAELERADRRAMDLRAYDLAQRAWQLLYQWTKAGIETATELAERALEIDPKNGSAHAVLVGVELLNWRRCWRGSPAETLESALNHGRAAVELDKTEYAGHWYLSEVYLFRLKDLEQARVHAERAVKLCPNASGPLAWMGFINGCSGEHQAGIEFCNRALRLDPFAPDYLQYLAGCVHFNAGNYEEAIRHLHGTQWLSKPELLSATYVHMGRISEARDILTSHTDSIVAEMTSVPDDWFAYFAERCPYVREKDIAHYLSGLEAALE